MSIIAIILSIFGAFFQALGSAIKKKSLQFSGMNNIIAFFTFMVASLIFACAYFLTGESLGSSNLSIRFWQAIFWSVGLNIVAVWFMFRALDLAEFSYLMPFMTLTGILMVVPPIFIFGEIPTLPTFFGIILVVSGAFVMNFKRNIIKDSKIVLEKNQKGLIYFLVTALCYVITPTVGKMAIEESSVLFASLTIHLLSGLGFLILIIFLKESGRIKEVLIKSELRPLLLAVIMAGFIMAVENGSINAALKTEPVASVMAIKRSMPFFAFLIGVFYFKEKSDLKKKILATILMVAGAVLVTVYTK